VADLKPGGRTASIGFTRSSKPGSFAAAASKTPVSSIALPAANKSSAFGINDTLERGENWIYFCESSLRLIASIPRVNWGNTQLNPSDYVNHASELPALYNDADLQIGISVKLAEGAHI
jgi:hypothetical protein